MLDGNHGMKSSFRRNIENSYDYLSQKRATMSHQWHVATCHNIMGGNIQGCC